MKTFLVKMFSDESGNPSSNRLLGALALLLGLVLAAVGYGDRSAPILTTAGALLGIGQIKSAAVLASLTKKTDPPKETPPS
jgi:hypothetical protein